MPNANIDTRSTASLDWFQGDRYDHTVPFTVTTGRLEVETRTQKKNYSRTSGYHAKVKKGTTLPPLPYHHSKTRSSNYTLGNYAEYDEYWNGSKYDSFQKRWRTGVVSLPGASASDTLLSELTAQAESQAITKLLNKAKDSKVNGAVAYAESKQVAQMVTKAATTIGEVLHHLRRGNLVGAADTVGLVVGKRQAKRFRKEHANIKTDADIDRVLSNGILQVQYGIRPLVSDVIGAAELLAQKNSREVLSFVKSNVTCEGERTTRTSSTLPRGKSIQTLVRSASVTVSYGVTFSQSEEVVHTLKQLGLTNPFTLGWELLPWSFVVDWFIPIGNVISSWDATLGLDFSFGYKSVRVKNHFTRSTLLVPGHPRTFFTGNGFSFGELDSFERTTLTGFPSPRAPQFKSPVSFEHALNAIALLAGFKKQAYFKTKQS